MSTSSYDPRAMIGVMRILEESSDVCVRPGFSSTDPDSGNRAEPLQQLVAAKFPQSIPAEQTLGGAFRWPARRVDVVLMPARPELPSSSRGTP